MEYFNSLGVTLASEWASRNFDSEAFPDLAMRALERSRLCDHVTAEEIPEWAATVAWLPYQPNLNTRFGEPPITLFWHPKFYIEALHWTVGTPEIHRHTFSGAFAILEGSSIQSRYTFETEKRVSARMALGKLRLKEVRWLAKGDLEPIRSGDELIHSVFHLETPSVTIVVRTNTDVENQPQYRYHRPGLAIDPFYKDANVLRRVQMLAFLDKVNSPRFADIAELSIVNSDLYGAYLIFDYLRFSPNGLKVFDSLIDVARQRHGSDIDRLRAVLEESDREAVIRSRRAFVTLPDHRFLLALLMNVPSRDAILDIVSRRFPGRDAKDLVAQWAFDMSGVDLSGVEFDDLNRLVFRHLMDGMPVSEVVRRLGEEYEFPETETGDEQLAEHCRQMLQSMFGPLLQAGTT